MSPEWCAQARCSARAISQFYNELATMMGTGIPIDQGLSIISEYAAEDSVAVVAHELQTRVSSGQMLSAAMIGFPRIFSPLAVSV
ncbi:type II secretion system F family protein, partial [Escherichia coli]|uniref:type II secretion system F family protein n=1 Tax=Escherichia coli TaxID=562 RepID=UPI0034D963B7